MTARRLRKTESVATRVAAADWDEIGKALDADGCAVLPALLAPDACASLAAGYGEDAQFRSRVVMARHGFGRGEYKYFAYPLPELIAELRTELYPRLAPVARRWHAAMGLAGAFPPNHAAMGLAGAFPPTHAGYLKRCHDAGQTRPTPLLLRYGAGDYNCLHQDLYGELAFPIQATIQLSAPGEDFTGGEFVLVEQRPRMQSRPHVVPLAQGDAVLFAVNDRPVAGTRGTYRVKMRHGVSRITRGTRTTLGVIFHDAR